MASRRLVWGARLVLLLGIASSVLWLARLDRHARLSTDVLELMPADERDPELALVRSLASERQGRQALLALSHNPLPGEAGAAVTAESSDVFVASLRASGAFRDVVNVGDPAQRQDLGRFIFERRFDLLLPGWLARTRAAFAAEAASNGAWSPWLAERVCEELDTFLAEPEAVGFEQMLPADPLLLVPRLVGTMQGLGGMEGSSRPDGAALIWAEAIEPPLREEGQGPLFAAVDAALARARAADPRLELKWTAVSRFAAESRRRIEGEFKGLNLFALGAVVLVLVLSLRRAWQVVHLVPVMACSLLGAWTVTTLVFERAHMLVFVIGSLLGGVAVDYGLHVFLHRAGDETDFRARMRGLWGPLVGSAVTTLIGFSLLASSSLPLLRQTGVFVCAGVVSAAVAAVLWFAQAGVPVGTTRLDDLDAAQPQPARGRRVLIGLLAVGAIISVVGPWHLRWHDDIRELEIRSPELWENDHQVRALFGGGDAGELLLTRGASVAQARAALDVFQLWLARTAPQARMASVGLALPLEDQFGAAFSRVGELSTFENDLRAALERHGYEPAGFEPFFAAWRELRARTTWPNYGEVVQDFSAALRGPLSMPMQGAPGSSWFGVLVEDAPGGSIPEETATVRAGQVESLNHLFGRYRVSALRLSVIGLALIAASVVAMYGPRRGVRMAVVPVGAVLFVFGLFGLLGQTLNLFHLLGAFLAVGMTIDYAIFAVHRTGLGHGLPASVRLSAMTTIASFGVLGFSAIPVVSALGVTVASIIATGWGLVEILTRLERA